MPLTLVNKTKRVNESLCDHVFGYSAMGEHTHTQSPQKNSCNSSTNTGRTTIRTETQRNNSYNNTIKTNKWTTNEIGKRRESEITQKNIRFIAHRKRIYNLSHNVIGIFLFVLPYFYPFHPDWIPKVCSVVLPFLFSAIRHRCFDKKKRAYSFAIAPHDAIVCACVHRCLCGKVPQFVSVVHKQMPMITHCFIVLTFVYTSR